ncbi:SNF2 family N-terminal domain containing protein [Aphelenchoides bicaudatus]|nr:SNF2 family N-terminal domain containing protein [Aphelenchoides bicaudatus]
MISQRRVRRTRRRRKKMQKTLKLQKTERKPKKSQKKLIPMLPCKLSINSRSQKRRALRNNVKVETSDEAQAAQRLEQERLERLEKSRQNLPTTAASYESVPGSSNQNCLMNFVVTGNEKNNDMTEQCVLLRRSSDRELEKKIDNTKMIDIDSAFEEKSEDDDIILERVVPKPQIEVVDLSSDDEDQGPVGRRLINPAYVRGITSKKFASPQLQEELRARRLKRSEDNLDSMELNANGLLRVNDGSLTDDPPVYISEQLTQILQPHQIGGIRFMYDNIIESVNKFDVNAGFGCIIAHSMGLGKTIQVIAFTEIFLRVTPCKRTLVICPVNVIQNWQNEFDHWLPRKEGVRDFPVFLLGDLVKSQTARLELVSKWTEEGGVLLVGYEMFRLLTVKKRKRKENANQGANTKNLKEISADEANEIFYEALIDPGADLVVCDEGHRIKNLKTDVARALSDLKTRRRIVLTGYPLQNNLLEYYCMIDFVRPSYLGSKKHFQLMFDRPIKNGMCIDSTKKDIKIAKQRTHVLIKMLRGFVQRRSHHLLKKILPDSKEYVVILRKTPIQKNLYKEFVKFIQKELTGEDANYYNPLKAHAVCSKIWNHPDLLYKAWEKQLELLDYTDLANAVDAAEGNMLNKMQTNEQSTSSEVSTDNGFSSHLEMAPPPQSNYYNQQFQSNTFNQPQQMNNFNFMNLQQQAASQFSSNMTMQNNYPNQWANQTQFMTPPPSNQTLGYSPMSQMQSPTSVSANVSITVSTMNGKGKRRNESLNEISEFDKASKKKRPNKKKLVQLITDDDEGGSIPYYWADAYMGDYMQGVLENSHKMEVALQIIRETVKRGEKILLFSTSLLTLSLIEDFLKMYGSIEMEGGVLEWKRNVNYFRFDGSTSAMEREKMINQFNSDPAFPVFLISTRAGSLGVNLVSASRVIIMDCSWNPCHDAQAVCRIYRYGQKSKTYIYRLIMHNSMEKAIFARQISKHGLQQRVVDEQLVEANVTQRELENLIAYDEVQDNVDDNVKIDTSEWKIEDDLLNSIAMTNPKIFAECPFLHESLMLESEDQLSNEEQVEAEILYEREKKGLLYTSQLAPVEAPQINYGNAIGISNNFPNSISSFPSYLQPALNNRIPQMLPTSMYAAPINRMQYNPQLPATMQHLNPMRAPLLTNSNRMPLVPNSVRPPFNVQMLNPARTNSRPASRSSHVIQNRRVTVDEDLDLNCVSRPGEKIFISKGESVLVVKTASGGVYLRTDNGQIADASNTIYAKPPNPEDIIELD